MQGFVLSTLGGMIDVHRVADAVLGASGCAVLARGIDLSSLLEGQGDLVGRLIMGIIRVTIWVIGVINLHTKSP